MGTVQKILQIFIYVVLVALVLVFAMENNEQKASVQFLQWQTVIMPIWILILLSLIIGLAIGLLLTTGLVIQANRDKRRYQKEMKRIQAELNRMRNVSIEEDSDTEAVAESEEQEKTKK